jgi:hypothetical protein
MYLFTRVLRSSHFFSVMGKHEKKNRIAQFVKQRRFSRNQNKIQFSNQFWVPSLYLIKKYYTLSVLSAHECRIYRSSQFIVSDNTRCCWFPFVLQRCMINRKQCCMLFRISFILYFFVFLFIYLCILWIKLRSLLQKLIILLYSLARNCRPSIYSIFHLYTTYLHTEKTLYTRARWRDQPRKAAIVERCCWCFQWGISKASSLFFFLFLVHSELTSEPIKILL